MGEPPNSVLMTIIAGPCAASKDVTIGLYHADSKLSIPNVFADPRDKATIKINYFN